MPQTEYCGRFLIPELYRSFTAGSYLCWENCVNDGTKGLIIFDVFLFDFVFMVMK